MEGEDIGTVKENRNSLLVKKVKAGDMEAFEELVTMHKERAYKIAYQMTNSHADADDLSQEAFIKVYRSINSFDERSSFNTWLYRIVVNLSINHLKKEKRQKRFSIDRQIIIGIHQQSGLAAMAKASPRKALGTKELHDEFTKVVDSLPLAEKTVVVLAILQGVSHKEIAEIEDCPEKTISWRLFNARKKLRKKLQVYLRS